MEEKINMNNNRTIIIACVLVGVGAIMAGVGYLSGGYKSVKEFKGFSIGQNIKDNSKCTKKMKNYQLLRI